MLSGLYANRINHFLSLIVKSIQIVSACSVSYLSSLSEIKYIGIYNLDGNGSINELGFDSEISNNLHLLGAINKIKGNNTEMNQYSAMEDFSHIRMELKYYY